MICSFNYSDCPLVGRYRIHTVGHKIKFCERLSTMMRGSFLFWEVWLYFSARVLQEDHWLGWVEKNLFITTLNAPTSDCYSCCRISDTSDIQMRSATSPCLTIYPYPNLTLINTYIPSDTFDITSRFGPSYRWNAWLLQLAFKGAQFLPTTVSGCLFEGLVAIRVAPG